jgi:CBS domain containing-hemolysin-like protein
VGIALGFSFLCSIAEAVLLSVTSAYIALQEEDGHASGKILRGLKDNINQPLAAILTLNTIAHTAGAAGAGAQAAAVFGSAYLGIASAILTLLILVFSEIIPKTLGATYWRQLAPATAFVLRFLVWILYPFVKMSEWLTRGLTEAPTLSGYSRQEFAAMADLGAAEGELGRQESQVVKNLLALQDTPVHAAMTPRTVLFSLSDQTTVEEFFHRYEQEPFSRIPVYAKDDADNVTGFVLRSDLLLAQARGNNRKLLENYRREMPSVPETLTLRRAFNRAQQTRSHMMLVVDEYGDMQGILTLEDIIETLLGLEIVDESDSTIDMQELARRKWRRRARDMGISAEESTP